MGNSLNRRWFNVASAPGTGDVAVGSAVAGHLGLGAAHDGMSFDGVAYLDGSDFEVRNGCTYTHGTTTLSRGTLEESSTGSAISLSSSTTVMLSVSADAIRRFESAGLRTVAGPNSNTSMAVGNLYLIDGSALTGDRTYTLPAVAAVDDRVAVKMESGSSAYEVILTAASGDTLEGIAGGTEWSRIFIEGESVVFRCTVANAEWIVDVGCDGRIPQQCDLELTTACDGESANTFTRPTAAATPGAWTARIDNANLAVVASDRINLRRGGAFICIASARQKDSPADQAYFNVGLYKSAGASLVVLAQDFSSAGSSQNPLATNSRLLQMVADDYLVFQYRSQAGGLGLIVNQAWFSVMEVL